MRKLLVTILVLLLVNGASATIIDHESVSIDLATSEVSVELEVQELTSSRLTYFTDHEVNDLSVTVDGRPLDCQVYSSETNNQISCETDVKNNFTARIQYTSSGLVDVRGERNTFEMKENFIRPIENYTLEVLLPKGNIIMNSNNTESVISPSYAQIGTDGQRISVKWSETPVLGSSQDYKVVYQGGEPRNYLLEQIGGAVIVLIIFGIGAFIFKKLREEDLDSVYKELEDDEKQVLELLRSNEGSMLQKDVVEQLDYSKAKISGTVSTLVEKEVIKKEKEGRSNRVSIRKNYRY